MVFFADPPHLIKTTRNCIFHSGMSLYLFSKSKMIKWTLLNSVKQNIIVPIRSFYFLMPLEVFVCAVIIDLKYLSFKPIYD